MPWINKIRRLLRKGRIQKLLRLMMVINTMTLTCMRKLHCPSVM